MLTNNKPLAIGLSVHHDYNFYGSEVDTLKRCHSNMNHSALVVGHGIEDGLECWLIRDSHSTDWDLNGQWKWSSKARKGIDTIDCIWPNFDP